MLNDILQFGISLITLGVMFILGFVMLFVIMAVVTSIAKDKSYFKKLEMRFFR